jgi:transcriptional regulator with XRE-family HTH domain
LRNLGRLSRSAIQSGTSRDTGGHLGTGEDVDDAPYTGDLDLTAVTTRSELAGLLRTVHLRADRPSLRTLEATTRHSVSPLSKTAVAEMLKATRFPRRTVMVAFLQACRVPDSALEPWLRAWERVAARESPAQEEVSHAVPGSRRADRPPGSHADPEQTLEPHRLREQVAHLIADNERLRLQLAAASRDADGHGSHPDRTTDPGSVHSPAGRRRELGIVLRTLRAENGMTIEQVAGHLLCSAGKISRIERGHRSGTLRDVRDLCDLYQVAGTQRDHLMTLAREGRQEGWWQSYDLQRFSIYVGLEDDATRMNVFEGMAVPGLLQTADYIRAILEAGVLRSVPEAVEQAVEVRLTRQNLLTRPNPPHLWAILDESVLHREVGGLSVIRIQLDRLIEVAEWANVTLQIIPYDRGALGSGDSGFNIMEFAGSVPDIAYTEGHFSFVYLEKPAEVERYREIFQILRTTALSEKESIEFIAKIRRSMH